MKKITSTFLTAAICLAAHFVCDAQFITLGIKASGGASTMKFDFDRDFATEFVPSYSLGGAFNVKKTDRFWYGFEVLYSRSGYRYPQSHFIGEPQDTYGIPISFSFFDILLLTRENPS